MESSCGDKTYITKLFIMQKKSFALFLKHAIMNTLTPSLHDKI